VSVAVVVVVAVVVALISKNQTIVHLSISISQANPVSQSLFYGDEALEEILKYVLTYGDEVW